MSQNRHSIPRVDFELPSGVFGMAEDHEHGHRIVPHRHDSAQLIHASSGVMRVETDDGVWVVPPQRAVWVPAFVTHSIEMVGPVQLRTLYIQPEMAPIESTHCCVVQVSELLHAGIVRAIRFAQPIAEGSADSRLVAVILDEIRVAPTAPLHLPMPSDPRARRIAEAFRRNPADRRRLADWARSAGASERTLERVFAREVGTTFGKWQQQVRLLRGLEVLASGDSVTAAALEVGFETPSAFIAMFRRAMGTTPARYYRSDPGT